MAKLKVEVDLTEAQLGELDALCKLLNIPSREDGIRFSLGFAKVIETVLQKELGLDPKEVLEMSPEEWEQALNAALKRRRQI